ncbi:hypothetical protein ACWHLZ_32965 [Streptomyces chartreusis]|uniref:hypothetical protein n=1 Tax=Streptomyces TaxID=1883 RepID=UPI002E80D1FA|nr:hypothetical protein [Streptomyces chartreusis]WSZ69500.1 hypothetical protein OG938_28105 [Streptomyces chartreusis]WTA27488.1 hypothetical protein OIA45_16325 [Streptomyces chartreusis]WUB18124.1 hypothetical protein OG997_15945 [Streptomyces chartreusis]
MSKKFAVITALALSTVVSAAGVASAGGYGNGGNGTSTSGTTTTVKGGSGFSSGPVVVNEPQQGVLVVNGTVIDGRCIAPWSNGAVLGGVAAPNSHYAACNTEKVDQSQKSPYVAGLLF